MPGTSFSLGRSGGALGPRRTRATRGTGPRGERPRPTNALGEVSGTPKASFPSRPIRGLRTIGLHLGEGALHPLKRTSKLKTASPKVASFSWPKSYRWLLDARISAPRGESCGSADRQRAPHRRQAAAQADGHFRLTPALLLAQRVGPMLSGGGEG